MCLFRQKNFKKKILSWSLYPNSILLTSFTNQTNNQKRKKTKENTINDDFKCDKISKNLWIFKDSINWKARYSFEIEILCNVKCIL